MKRFLSFVVGLVCLCAAAQAEVPSLINYQGRLKEKNGTNVNGTKNFSLRIFDAKTGGKQIYPLKVGSVAVKGNLAVGDLVLADIVLVEVEIDGGFQFAGVGAAARELARPPVLHEFGIDRQ